MNIINLALLEKQLGPLTYPLLACSLIGLVVLAERFAVLSYYALSNTMKRQSLHLMQQHHQAPKDIREEVAAVWLQMQSTKLANGIRLLNIITLLAPLLGLLGTVIGLIQVFDTLGLHQGPIQPNMLAEGLGIAMKTTAAGLIIAVPTLLGAHGFQLWVDKIVHSIAHKMNIHNFEMDGISTEALA